MRQQLIHLIREEIKNAKKGLPSGIVMKMNSLEDKETIDELYRASKAGVPIRCVVRGICCLRPGRPGLSENIEVRSVVGDYLEHARLFYFHQAGQPKVYAGSADLMVRSFDRRIEALFLIVNPQLKRETISILMLNLQDNQNTYLMREDGAYVRVRPGVDEAIVNVHRDFYRRDEERMAAATPEGLLDLLLQQAIRNQQVEALSPEQVAANEAATAAEKACEDALLEEAEYAHSVSIGEGEVDEPVLPEA